MIRFAHVVWIAVVTNAPALLTASCASTDPDPSSAISDAALRGANTLRNYEVKRAELAARHEREHSRMETAHERENAALESALVAALMNAGEEVRAAQAKLVEKRKVFRAAALARLERLDAVMERANEGDATVATAELDDLVARRNFVLIQVVALDAISDESWFDAKERIDDDLVALERIIR